MTKYSVSDEQCSVSEKAMNPWAQVNNDQRGSTPISDAHS